MNIWMKPNKVLIVTSDGRPIECSHCPCEPPCISPRESTLAFQTVTIRLVFSRTILIGTGDDLVTRVLDADITTSYVRVPFVPFTPPSEVNPDVPGVHFYAYEFDCQMCRWNANTDANGLPDGGPGALFGWSGTGTVTDTPFDPDEPSNSYPFSASGSIKFTYASDYSSVNLEVGLGGSTVVPSPNTSEGESVLNTTTVIPDAPFEFEPPDQDTVIYEVTEESCKDSQSYSVHSVVNIQNAEEVTVDSADITLTLTLG